MKLFKRIFRCAAAPQTVFVMALLVLALPNLCLAVTEPVPFVYRLVNILLPVSLYAAALTFRRRPGLVLWVLFPLVFLSAFQFVLIYLYGHSVIAVDMFLNLLTTAAPRLRHRQGLSGGQRPLPRQRVSEHPAGRAPHPGHRPLCRNLAPFHLPRTAHPPRRRARGVCARDRRDGPCAAIPTLRLPPQHHAAALGHAGTFRIRQSPHPVEHHPQERAHAALSRVGRRLRQHLHPEGHHHGLPRGGIPLPARTPLPATATMPTCWHR